MTGVWGTATGGPIKTGAIRGACRAEMARGGRRPHTHKRGRGGEQVGVLCIGCGSCSCAESCCAVFRCAESRCAESRCAESHGHAVCLHAGMHTPGSTAGGPTPRSSQPKQKSQTVSMGLGVALWVWLNGCRVGCFDGEGALKGLLRGVGSFGAGWG